jgi:hypothetical protein
VPLVIVAVVGLVWLLMSRMPFGSDGDRAPRERAAIETIGEGKVDRGRETLPPNTDLQDEPEPAPAATATAIAPPAAATTATVSAPPPATPMPAEREITEEQAVAVLRGFVASNERYLVRAECLRIGSRGYSNAGYTLDVYDTCESPGAPRSRWRVDSKTREVFVQREDGRFLRP